MIQIKNVSLTNAQSVVLWLLHKAGKPLTRQGINAACKKTYGIPGLDGRQEWVGWQQKATGSHRPELCANMKDTLFHKGLIRFVAVDVDGRTERVITLSAKGKSIAGAMSKPSVRRHEKKGKGKAKKGSTVKAKASKSGNPEVLAMVV